MDKFDTRWVTVPIMGLLAHYVGDVSWWTVSLVFIATLKVVLIARPLKRM